MFSETGLTSSSATHLCNTSVEYAKIILQSLEDTSFVNKSFTPVTTGTEINLSNGLSNLDSIQPKINKLIKYYEFNAYFREAVSIKNDMINKHNNVSFDKYCDNNNLDFDYDYIVPKSLSLSFEDQIQYKCAQAEASTIGNLIHKDKPINKARVELNKITTSPKNLSTHNELSIVYSYTPSIDVNLVDNLFFELQTKHREAQAKVNKYEFKLNDMQSEENKKVFKTNLQLEKEMVDKKNICRKEYQLWHAQELERLSQLRITIPDKFQDLIKELK